MRKHVAVAIAVELVALAPLRGQAPSSVLTGFVHDESGTPIPFVRISPRGSERSVQSDSEGHFVVRGLSEGKTTFLVRRMGFEPAEFVATLDAHRRLNLDITLTQNAVAISGAMTTAESRVRRVLAGFFRRRESKAGGTFLVRADIEKRDPSRLSDLLRVLPSLTVLPSGNGRTSTRSTRASGLGRECAPDIWVDGTHALGLNVDDIQPRDVEAMEIYSGPATIPPEYRARFSDPTCGAIGIWTRVP